MDSRLLALINDYLDAVSTAVALLEKAGIPRPKSNTDWVGYDMPQIGVLPGNVKYAKHGYGIVVHLQEGEVDFDFGASGQINGFDDWRLVLFSEERPGQHGFNSEEEIKQSFKAAVATGAFEYSGYILYYLRPQSRSFT